MFFEPDCNIFSFMLQLMYEFFG